MLLSFRRELMLDIVMGAYNESIEHVRSLLEQNNEVYAAKVKETRKMWLNHHSQHQTQGH
ncbi:hypothetical protein AHAS_Ahas20G0141900 [Arachis hypogaea]